MTVKSDASTSQAQDFVLARGFVEFDGVRMLSDQDRRPRIFLELSADPEVRVAEVQNAFQLFLASVPNGQSIRLLFIRWPGPEPRLRFLRQLDSWTPPSNNPLISAMCTDLRLFTLGEALPFFGRTILEVVLHSNDSHDWAASTGRLLADHGIGVRPLPADEVQALAYQLFNPRF